MTEPPALDDLDRVLIGELIADGRATYAKLAPVVELSQAATRTRVQRLLDERIVVVTGRVDPATFGLGVFAFAFLQIDREVDKTAARIAEIDEAVFIAISSGRFDMLVEVRCADMDGLLNAFDRIRVIDGVRRLQSATAVHYEKQDWSSIGDRAANPRPRQIRADAGIDDVDRRLLSELIADGRATYAALAPAVGLSQAAVRDRVIDLIQSEVIAIETHPVPEAMGISGFSGVAIKATGPVKPIVEAMTAMTETTLVARTLGRYDVTAEIWFDDQDHLADVLERLREIPQVGTIDTVPYLRIAKEQFRTGGRK